jgi:heme/copper-type cytochrome/quinol oxidase subunit 2
VPHHRRRRALQLALLIALLLVTAGCGAVKPGISGKAQDVHGLFSYIFWLAVPVFLFVEGMLVIGVIRFRTRRQDDGSEPVQTRGHNVAYGAFFAVPLAIVVALLSYGEVTVGRVDYQEPRPAEQLVITGSQWQWSATYAKEGLSVSGKSASETSAGKPLTMALPAGRTTQITLKSADVMHGFYVPDLLYMKNAIPGSPNVFTITPTKPGTYRGQCTQICGLHHSDMKLVLEVLPAAKFQAWVQDQKQATSKGGSCAVTGSSITLTAQHITWDKGCVAAAAGQPIKITLINKDDGIAHNFAIWQSSALKHRIYVTPDVSGPATKTFTGPALPAGKYYFQCDVHGPAMSGTLIIGKPGS